MDVLSELVATEFLALMEVSDRLPESPMNHLANANGRMPIASGTEQPTENKSVGSNCQTHFVPETLSDAVGESTGFRSSSCCPVCFVSLFWKLLQSVTTAICRA
jgi:hypothetical protein